MWPGAAGPGALSPRFSARANLEFFGRIYGLGGSRLRQRVDDVLDIVGLTERANARVDTYSGGMKRRVNIAAGLVHEPKLLFLDEPTVGVDPQSRNHIFQSVQRLNRERGMTVVYIRMEVDSSATGGDHRSGLHHRMDTIGTSSACWAA